jgi:hypothetical protein
MGIDYCIHCGTIALLGIWMSFLQPKRAIAMSGLVPDDPDRSLYAARDHDVFHFKASGQPWSITLLRRDAPRGSAGASVKVEARFKYICQVLHGNFKEAKRSYEK